MHQSDAHWLTEREAKQTFHGDRCRRTDHENMATVLYWDQSEGLFSKEH